MQCLIRHSPSFLPQTLKFHGDVLRHSTDDLLGGAEGGSCMHRVGEMGSWGAKRLRDNPVPRGGQLGEEAGWGQSVALETQLIEGLGPGPVFARTERRHSLTEISKRQAGRKKTTQSRG